VDPAGGGMPKCPALASLHPLSDPRAALCRPTRTRHSRARAAGGGSRPRTPGVRRRFARWRVST